MIVSVSDDGVKVEIRAGVLETRDEEVVPGISLVNPVVKV